MFRIRISLPKTQRPQAYNHQDIIHDALVNAWDKAGLESQFITGEFAKNWNFAPLGYHRKHNGYVHSLIVSTPDPELGLILQHFKAEHITKRRWDEHFINFSEASIEIEPAPIFPKQQELSCLLLSPLVLKDKEKSLLGKKIWHKNIQHCPDLNKRINQRLSKIANREVHLNIIPDPLYLRANPEHSVLVQLKQKQYKSFVIGMQFPLVLQGSEDDLRLAWYAGLGEKARNGFGCLGLAEQGVS